MAWTSGGKNIRKTDLALWINFGVTHVPRPEDFPVMPVEHCRLMLKPVGFFDKNPGVCAERHSRREADPSHSPGRPRHDRPILGGGVRARRSEGDRRRLLCIECDRIQQPSSACTRRHRPGRPCAPWPLPSPRPGCCAGGQREAERARAATHLVLGLYVRTTAANAIPPNMPT